MTRTLSILFLCALTGGCVLVPTDGWPKPAWYWSNAAKEHREVLRQEQAATNQVQTSYGMPSDTKAESPDERARDLVKELSTK